MKNYGQTLANLRLSKDHEQFIILYGELQLASLTHAQPLKYIGILCMDFNSLGLWERRMLGDYQVHEALELKYGSSVYMIPSLNAVLDF